MANLTHAVVRTIVASQVSNVIPSMLLEVVNTRAEDKYAKFLPDTQCAMHFARSFAQDAAGGGYNACLLFLRFLKKLTTERWLSDVGAVKLTLRVSCNTLALTVMISNGALIFSRLNGSVIQEAGLSIELVDLHIHRWLVLHAREWLPVESNVCC